MLAPHIRKCMLRANILSFLAAETFLSTNMVVEWNVPSLCHCEEVLSPKQSRLWSSVDPEINL